MVRVNFIPTYGNIEHLISEDDDDLILDSTTITIDKFRCYISNVELVSRGGIVYKERDSYHLLDAEISESLSFILEADKMSSIDSIRFMVGIDSITSVSGAMGGDLDPTKGMFWTWQTGYIFFKLEGRSLQSATRKNRFVYHIGGYEGEFAAQQRVALPLNREKEINIVIDLDDFVDQLDLSVQPNLMSPGEKAFEQARVFSSIFNILD